MSAHVLLDTNALLWLSEGNDRLGPKARRRLEKGIAAGGVSFSPISIWEVAVLVRKARYGLRMSLSQWRAGLLDNGLLETPLDGTIAIRAEDFASLHTDPADRLIAATADCLRAHLMTADAALLAWAGARGIDARV